jgi:uncharacterized protein
MKFKAQFYGFFWLILLPILGWGQYNIPNVPSIQTSVYDYADVLNNEEEQILKEKLIH